MTTDQSQLTTSNASPDDEPVTTYRSDEDESVAEAVVSAVSTARRTDPTKLEPLYGTVAPDALDSLFDSRVAEAVPGDDVSVIFEYESYRVRIENGDRVALY